MSSISVLMSVYKSEKAEYLNRSLRSIWDDQTCKPDEIVLVEDGPLGDDLIAVISSWKERLGDKLCVLKNETNIGLTKSLNKGLAYVKSEFVARMDSDDISAPQRFELQLKYMNEHPDVSIVGGSLQEFDDKHECLSVRRYPLTNNEVVKYIYKASPLAHPAVMMRRSIFDAGLRYNEQYRTSQDIALWYDALCAGYKIGNIEEVAVHFRRDANVFKRRSRKKAMNEYRIYMNGIKRLYGVVTWRYIYPMLRIMFRLMPVKIIRLVYGSNIRKIILEKFSLS